MEEKILEIISKVDKGDGYFIPHILRKKFYADDIADNFRKFLVYWVGKDDVNLNLDNDFDYWWNNIKDK